MTARTERISAYLLFFVMLASLAPVMYLGLYNHPTGDDYFYGADTRLVWDETGNILETAAEATRGTIYQYQHWQGTYSAMFLMHLPPNIFGEWAYPLFTFVILTFFSGGIFYLMNPLEYRQRLSVLEDSGVRDVVFRPYEHRPDMLYVGDFNGDPQHETALKVAQYFRKDSLYVSY